MTSQALNFMITRKNSHLSIDELHGEEGAVLPSSAVAALVAPAGHAGLDGPGAVVGVQCCDGLHRPAPGCRPAFVTTHVNAFQRFKRGNQQG